MKTKTILMTGLLTIAIVVASCSKNTPEDVVTSHIEAAMAGNKAEMKAALSDLAVQAYVRKLGEEGFEKALTEKMEMYTDIEKFEIGEVESRSGYKKVTIAFTRTDGKVKITTWPVRKKEDTWQIDELRSPN